MSVNQLIITNLKEEHGVEMRKHELTIEQLEAQNKKIELEMRYIEIEHKARMALYEMQIKQQDHTQI